MASSEPTSMAEQFAALQHQARPRRWLIAALVGGAVGLFANLVLGWPFTLLAAIVTVVGLLLGDRRYGMLAGWWPGDAGVHRLAATAAHLERAGWMVIRIPAAAGQNTHADLFVGPGGVFVVEHQTWTVTDTVTTSPTTGLLLIGGRLAVRRTARLRATTDSVTHALSEHLPDPLTVRPVLAVEGTTLHHPRTVAGITIVPITDLARHIRRTETALSETDIATIITTARRHLPAR